MKIEQCSSIIARQSRIIVAEPKIMAFAYFIFSIVLGPRNFDNLTNKQLPEGNKLHLPLIRPIYSRHQNADLRTFLYP